MILSRFFAVCLKISFGRAKVRYCRIFDTEKGRTPRSEDRRLQTTFFGKESVLGLSGVDFLEKSVSKATTKQFRVSSFCLQISFGKTPKCDTVALFRRLLENKLWASKSAILSSLSA